MNADIVALDRANEGFSHSVALWTFERRRPRFEPDVAGEAAGVAGDVAAAVIRKPFDRDGQAIDLAEPVLDGSHHQVAHVLAGDAAGSGQEAHGFPITAAAIPRPCPRSLRFMHYFLRVFCTSPHSWSMRAILPPRTRDFFFHSRGKPAADENCALGAILLKNRASSHLFFLASARCLQRRAEASFALFGFTPPLAPSDAATGSVRSAAIHRRWRRRSAAPYDRGSRPW